MREVRPQSSPKREFQLPVPKNKNLALPIKSERDAASRCPRGHRHVPPRGERVFTRWRVVWLWLQ
jgi:hypothetical protein